MVRCPPRKQVQGDQDNTNKYGCSLVKHGCSLVEHVGSLNNRGLRSAFRGSIHLQVELSCIQSWTERCGQNNVRHHSSHHVGTPITCMVGSQLIPKTSLTSSCAKLHNALHNCLSPSLQLRLGQDSEAISPLRSWSTLAPPTTVEWYRNIDQASRAVQDLHARD